MRISTSQIYRQGLQGISSQQEKISFTQQQLSSGKRLTRPSDDPAAAVRSLEINEAIETSRQYRDNAVLVQSRLELEENVLTQVGDNLQRFRVLALQAANDSNDNVSRSAIAKEMGQILDAVLGLANTRDANDEYLYSGTRTRTQAFVQTAGGFSYAGDSQQRSVQISQSRQVAAGDPGDRVFVDIANGNGVFQVAANTANTGSGLIDSGSVTDLSAFVADTYSINFLTPDTYEVRDSALALVSSGNYQEGEEIAFLGVSTAIRGVPAAGDSFTLQPSTNQGLLDTLSNLAATVDNAQSSPLDSTQFHNQLNFEFAALDQALNRIIEVRTDVGARLNTIDTQVSVQEDLVLQLQGAQSEIDDLDYAEAISRFQLESVALQAAQQSFLQIQGLSLFNLLR